MNPSGEPWKSVENKPQRYSWGAKVWEWGWGCWFPDTSNLLDVWTQQIPVARESPQENLQMSAIGKYPICAEIINARRICEISGKYRQHLPLGHHGRGEKERGWVMYLLLNIFRKGHFGPIFLGRSNSYDNF